MNQQQMDKVSEIVADNGFIEWTLICFTGERDYHVYSYFTDPGIKQTFRKVLYLMLKKLDEHYLGEGRETTH